MRSILVAAAAFVALGLVAGSSGCDDSCTEVACADSSRLVFDPPLTAPGRYSIVLRPKLDGFEKWLVRCEVTLPWAGDGTPCDDYDTHLERTCVVDGKGTAAAVAECSSSVGIAAVTIASSTPHTVEVRVERDGMDLVSTSVHPSYETFHPNGPSCDGSACSQASTVVQLVP